MTAVAATTELPTRPRRWWIAAILSFFSAPAAYLYVGRPRRALALALFWLAVFLSLRSGLGGILAEPLAWLALIGVCAAALLFSLIDAARIARAERTYRLREWNQFWIYLVVVVVAGLANAAIVDSRLGGFLGVRPFNIPSGSMAPTLEIGDYAIGDMRAYARTEPAPGDVVLLDKAGDGGTIWVKRIVAGPGDKVALKDGVLFVNGVAMQREALAGAEALRARETLADGRSYVILPNARPFPALDEMAERIVPAGAYFVLGDNRGNLLDSRAPEFGFVPRAHVLGRLKFLYWSQDRARIGQTVR